MFTTRRWWERRGLQVGLLGLAVGSAFILRQTQGSLLLEVYQGISRPLEILQAGPTKEEHLYDAKVLELQTQVVELQNQNQQLKKMLSYSEKPTANVRPIPARVIGRSADNWWQQITLNRGSAASVKEGDIIKAEGGLVGIVDQVSTNTSRVLLISDLKSRVGVNISRTGAQGVLRGAGSVEGILEFNEKYPNVKVGDVISTSTYSQKYPSGLAIGQIKSLDLQRSAGSIAQVKLFPPISSLDWVMVYPYTEDQTAQQKPIDPKSTPSTPNPQKSKSN
jgi:rod shape-determining protein MreC